MHKIKHLRKILQFNEYISKFFTHSKREITDYE
jgi:hypothetical protein